MPSAPIAADGGGSTPCGKARERQIQPRHEGLAKERLHRAALKHLPFDGTAFEDLPFLLTEPFQPLGQQRPIVAGTMTDPASQANATISSRNSGLPPLAISTSERFCRIELGREFFKQCLRVGASEGPEQSGGGIQLPAAPAGSEIE